MTQHLSRRSILGAVTALSFTGCAAAVSAEPKGNGHGKPPKPSPTATPTATATATATPTSTPVATRRVIGMSAPESLWAERLAEVDPMGIKARRIFSSGLSNDKFTVVQATVRAGMLPVVSYKVPDVALAAQGAYDAQYHQIAQRLESLDTDVRATVWHEPNGDMTGPEFVAMHRRLMPILKRGKVTVGPILNGWLLDTATNTTRFGTYTSPDLLDLWDWFGFDTYANVNNPDKSPGDRIVLCERFLAGKGHAGMPILIGEYNTHTAATMAITGEQILSSATVDVAMVWNSTGTGNAGAVPLSGERLEAFKATKADERVLK